MQNQAIPLSKDPTELGPSYPSQNPSQKASHFSQGCPFSPIFAAIVLNEILTELQDLLNHLASQRLELGLKGDDNK
eukprot:scaffold36669_cov49-Cyclotella_meneghiniana.AAC.5